MSKNWQVTTSYGDIYTFANAFTRVWSGESSAPGEYTLAENDVFSYNTTSSEKFLSLTFTGTDLSKFTAGDDIDFTFSTDILNNFKNDSQGAINNFTNVNKTASWGKVEIAYSYDDVITAVPEPGTLAILALGLVGFAAKRKRKSV